MPTLTATADNTRAYVLVEADWTDVPEALHARVWRINSATGVEELLRPYIAYNQAGDLLLNCGIGVWWDTEPPLNTAVTYRTEAADVLVNTVTNSSFETGTGSWAATGGALAQSATFAHAGTFSGRVTPTGGVFESVISQTSVPVSDLLDITASAWVLTPQGWNSVYLELQFFASSTQLSSARSPIEILDDGEWRFLTFTETPPPGCDNVTIRAVVTGTAPNTTLFYWDQIEVAQYAPIVATDTAGPVTVVPDSPIYLKDPLNPCHDRPMTLCMPGPQVWTCDENPGTMMLSYGPREGYEPGGTALRPVNRPRLIPLVRPRRDTDTQAMFITRRFTDRDALRELFDPGTVLFLQVPEEYGIADRYIWGHVAYTIDRPLPDHRIPPRLFTFPHIVVDRPAGPANGPCGSRIRDLCNVYADWDAINTAGITYQELIEGAAG